jgi:hypothetical protein
MSKFHHIHRSDPFDIRVPMGFVLKRVFSENKRPGGLKKEDDRINIVELCQ